MLSSTQRQQLETRVYPASYERTFAAARDTLINHGYAIGVSDFDGGVLSGKLRVLGSNPDTALALSILAPIGDFYMGRYAWALVDLFLWPFSIAWAAPSNYMIAKRDWQEVTGTLSFEGVAAEKTRVRITLAGVDWDEKKYPVTIRRLQEEMNRQLFIKEGDTLDGEIQVQ